MPTSLDAEKNYSMLKTKSDVSFEDDWPKVKPTIHKLLMQENVSRAEWQDLFWNVHKISSWDDSCHNKVHKALHQDIKNFIQQAQARVMQHQDDSTLLKAYRYEWEKFFAQCSYLPLPFQGVEAHLNKNSSQKSTQKTKPEESLVRNLMLTCWNESIFSDIKDRLQEGAMKLILAERCGEAFDSQLVIGVRESYVNLGIGSSEKLKIYTDNFEKAYIDSTVHYYMAKAPEYLAQHGVRQYMVYAHKQLVDEEERAVRYLETGHDCDSMSKLIKCCVNVLVVKFKDTILAECAAMIKSNETENLQLMFKLMDRVEDGIVPMLRDLQDHIKEAGLSDMLACADAITSDSEQYVEKLLSLFHRFTELASKAFMLDARFLTARDMAYKSLVNDTCVFKLDIPTKVKGASKGQPESKCPELLANYCDMLLRKTPLSKKLTSEEIEKRLKDLLLVLKYVQNKDVFMRFHKAHLTRRLILDTSVDNEIEENMVDWLREIGMPAEYVNKLARMFQDIKVSEDLNNEFRELARNNSESYADVNIKVLNAGAWARASEKISVTLPSELEDLLPTVDEFYKKKHNGRKLQWNNLMSNGVVTFGNESGKFELEVTTFQMAILYCWNNRPGEELSFESIRLATQLPDTELRRTLWSLVALPKLKKQVLNYHPVVSNPKEFLDSTLFSVNQSFSLIKNGKVQKRGRISLIGRLQLSTEKSSEEDSEAIVHLRVLRVQEAIVTIMKTRKRLTNAALQTELVEMLKNMFLPSKKLIKEQIEWLIDNKYLRRDDEDINTFIYMA